MRSPLESRIRRVVARAVASIEGGADPRGLRILTYHRVNASHPRDRLTVHPEAFRRQLGEVIRSGRSVVTLEEGLGRLRSAEHGSEDVVALTFDDGYEDNVSQALPILESFGLPATFFLATGLVGTSQTLDRYRGCCQDDGMMSWGQARKLASHGHALGGHGHRHLELAALDPQAVGDEVERSAQAIERILGQRPRLFCYPRGSENAQVHRIVAEAGYEAACTVAPGPNQPGQDPLALRRTEVSGDDDDADFKLKLAGGFDGWHRLVQRRRRAS